MNARITVRVATFNPQRVIFEVKTSKGVAAQFNTRAEALTWAKAQGFTLRYSGVQS